MRYKSKSFRNGICPIDTIWLANYVIEYSNKRGYKITNLKLQQILFYSYVRYLLENDSKLFSDKILKGSYGAYIEIPYKYYRQYGASHILSEYIYKDRLVINGNIFSKDGKAEIVDYEDIKPLITLKFGEEIKEIVNEMKDIHPLDHSEHLVSLAFYKNKEYGDTYKDSELIKFFKANKSECMW